jgi:hypothetical protein
MIYNIINTTPKRASVNRFLISAAHNDDYVEARPDFTSICPI